MLARQDDRFHTLPYRYGYLNGFGPRAAGGSSTTRRRPRSWSRCPTTRSAEMTFVPRKKDAPEGDGYLIGIGSSTKETAAPT